MMAKPRIEHVNITVSDNARSAALFTRLFGWTIRWQGPSMSGGHSVHVGDADGYIALYSPPGTPAADAPTGFSFEKGAPLNHVGIEVADLSAVEAGVVAAGLTPFGHDDYEPGRRFYFFDWDGIEFEIISYA